MSFEPLFKVQKIFHGCDYNPEQWLEYPEILDKDLEMMKQAHINIVSLGIFSWAKLEPSEGNYDFSWLDDILDRLNENGIKVFLATPSGARPAWLSQKYPEVLRVLENRIRALHGGRHNHCSSSPLYREKVRNIDTKLAERYAHHPAVIGWHISNEYSGSCHCELCQNNFREWLKKKYGSLDNLNRAYWSTFWSHTYTDWSQVESPSSIGENAVHALNLDWKRFNTELCMDFCSMEIDAVKSVESSLPVTTNFMEYFYDYDYFMFEKVLDFISWDSYPQWHVLKDQEQTPLYTAMNHDLMRSLKCGKPFVLMESTPSLTNWRDTSKLKKPGMHKLSSLQALAHGADNIQYFQWRKSRGSSEKFHGAVIDHVGHLNTRVGKEVCELGEILEKLNEIAGSRVKAKVALVFDTQNRWAIDDSQGPRNKDKKYLEVVQDYYKVLWKHGINTDVIDETCSLDGYQVVIAPMAYMIRGDFAERIKAFVEKGGTLVSTFWSGIVDENDLTFLNGFPGPLKEVLGIWDEETECLEDDESVGVLFEGERYSATHLCALVHPEKKTDVLATFDDDFFKGYPALTKNSFGSGSAYYVASRLEYDFISKLLLSILKTYSIKAPVEDLKYGVSCHTRYNDRYEYLFVGNYSDTDAKVTLNADYEDMLNSNTRTTGEILLKSYDFRVLRKDLKN